MYEDQTRNYDPKNLIHDTPFPVPCADWHILAINTTN